LGEVDTPRRISLEEQEQTGLARRFTYVSARIEPERHIPPVQSPANDALGQLVGGLMAEARTIHHADPVSRGKALLLKATAITIALGGFTLAALAVLDMLSFMTWLLLASLEWVVCFLYLAYNDWREHPSAIRWQWTNGLLGLMEREQEARLRAQDGKDWDE
jgi:hypothetical protein